jgi:diadenosine tetraphosphate (Ap4A) HIT family hydrolase
MIEFNSLRENDESIRPIYEDNHVLIGHAVESAVPGLYTIKPLLPKESVIELSDTDFAVSVYMQRQLRIGLRTLFNVAVCGLYVEEHPDRPVTSYTIPFHIDRLQERYSVDVYQPYIAEYLRSYSFSSSRQQIDTINAGMSDMLNSSSVTRDIKSLEKGFVRVVKPAIPLVETLEQKSRTEEVLEVFDKDELSVAPEGKKYFVCIGGNRNFQCFLGDSNMSRGEFILSHEDEIDDCLKPIYSDDQIIVRQDAEYAIPGFYIVSPRSHYRSIDEMPQDTYARCMVMVRDIKKGLSTLGLARAHIYNDEKYSLPAFAHFWVLPLHEEFIDDHNLNPTIYSRDIWSYLDSYPRYNVTKPQILEFNEEMRHYLNSLYTVGS